MRAASQRLQQCFNSLVKVSQMLVRHRKPVMKEILVINGKGFFKLGNCFFIIGKLDEGKTSVIVHPGKCFNKCNTLLSVFEHILIFVEQKVLIAFLKCPEPFLSLGQLLIHLLYQAGRNG